MMTDFVMIWMTGGLISGCHQIGLWPPADRDFSLFQLVGINPVIYFCRSYIDLAQTYMYNTPPPTISIIKYYTALTSSSHDHNLEQYLYCVKESLEVKVKLLD